MRVAIIGAGIAGLVVAHRLYRLHDITLFEANDYAGGHTHTIDVDDGSQTIAVDTGFIVYNDRTYPNFIALLRELGVASQPTSMSFSVRCEVSGLEYNGASVNALFAQRRNLLKPSFLRMLRDILRFNRASVRLLDAAAPLVTLGQYLDAEGYSAAFRQNYILPMGAAIWSSSAGDVEQMPARFFVEFFHNHGMLSLADRPQWRVVAGGSRVYVQALTARLGDALRLRCPVERVRRTERGVEIVSHAGSELYDRAVLACHSDQALALLADPKPAEREVLGAIAYQSNDVVLHTDKRLLPRAPLARACWNYHKLAQSTDRVAVTYWMNALQSLAARRDYCVTLNRSADIDPACILSRFEYAHPSYGPRAVAAQARRVEVSNVDRTHYCGAYWGWGFHEDGVRSALAVVREFGHG